MTDLSTQSPIPESESETPSRAPAHWRAMLRGMERLPNGMISRCVGAAARTPLPRFLRPLVLGTFARVTGIRVNEAEHPLKHYSSVADFFVRRLRPGVRVWPHDHALMASPVDGVMGQCGRITEGRLIQAKGRHYTAAELIGDPDQAAAFEGGLFLTIYLSPRHYHRIHTPAQGHVVRARHLPGALFPVHSAAVAEVDRLFARNERVACTIASTVGSCVVVAVGATNVGRISVAFDDSWGSADGVISNTRAGDRGVRTYIDPPALKVGAELMAFHLGSTVVLLAEPGLALLPAAVAGSEVTVGTPLARRTQEHQG